MPRPGGGTQAGAKTATPCPEAEFIRLGYQTGALNFHVACRDAETFRACVLATGSWPYNKFDPDAVAEVLGGMFGEFMLIEVGRASSPLIVVRLALWEHQRAGTQGYHRAGFRVIGVDIQPMPRYPHEFRQADAMQVLQRIADGTAPWPGAPYPDAIHASPPCQAYSQMTSCRPGLAAQYPALVDAARALLGGCGVPWVMENVGGSGLAEQDDLFGGHGAVLCGAMFGLPLYRHRLFEASFPLHAPHHPRHLAPTSKAGHWEPGTVISVAGHCSPVTVAREAMGIGWMGREELAESIPPAYAEHVGGFLLEHLRKAGAA